MDEHFIQCPYCWETISILLDTSVADQTYVEDCEVCCNPMELRITCRDYTLQSCEVRQLDQ